MKTCILLLFFFTSLGAKGQITFEKRFFFNEMRYAKSVLQEGDSGYIILGYGGSNNFRGYDGCLFKTNKYGDSVWAKPAGLSLDNKSYDVIKTIDNGYIYTGEIYIPSENTNLNMVKTDNNGNVEWTKNFGGVNWEEGYSIIHSNNNSFIMAGISNSINGPGAQPYDFYVIKTNSSGSLIWEQKIGGVSSEEAFSVCPASNNACIVAGKTWSYGSGIYLVKLDVNGDIVWTKTYENAPYAVCIQPALNGNYYVIAPHHTQKGYDEIIALKINEYGDTLWSKSYNGYFSYYPSYCISSNDGGLVITGKVSSNIYPDVLLLKANSNGDVLWNKTYRDISLKGEGGNCVKQTYDGGYIIAIDGLNNNYDSFIGIIKTDSVGCVVPIIDSIVGYVNVSINDTIYYYSIDKRGEEYNWTTGFGEIVSGQGYDTVAILWNQLGIDTLQLYVSNGCGIDSMSLIINVDTCVPPLLSSLYGYDGVYLFDTLEYFVNLIEGKSPVYYSWDVVCGTIISGQNSPSIVVGWNQIGIGSVSVTATNECGTDFKSIDNISIIYCAENSREKNSFSIFPNPSQGIINIEVSFNLKDYLIEIFDLNGRLFYHMKKSGNVNHIDLSNLPKGIYLIKLIMNNTVKIKKVIIN